MFMRLRLLGLNHPISDLSPALRPVWAAQVLLVMPLFPPALGYLNSCFSQFEVVPVLVSFHCSPLTLSSKKLHSFRLFLHIFSHIIRTLFLFFPSGIVFIIEIIVIIKI
jgi:hypothetical protein